MIVNDPAAERAVLASIGKYGANAYYEVADILTERSFSIDSNQIIWACFKKIFEQDEKAKIDIPSVYSAAAEMGLGYVFEKKQEVQHLNSIMNFPVELANTRKFAAKIRKLEVAKNFYASLEVAVENLGKITGDEKISDIIGIGEKAIYDFSNSILDKSQEPELLGKDIDAMLDDLENNPMEQVGISTGYAKYDFAIGGGLRPGSISIIGARMKVGKTLLADNIGKHIAGILRVPVLNMDTEMMKKDHQHRTLAMLSEVPISEIEKGQFAKNPFNKQKVREAAKAIKDMPYFHKCIGGMGFEEILATARRWLAKDVGLTIEGKAKPCVIIYDYIKLMSSETISGNMAEFQALGFMLHQMHDFAVRYEVPILAFVQLNRDGITKEDTDAIGASDRIGMLCSNFSIYKKKSDEEIAQDGPNNGTRKLVPIIARHGEGLSAGEYINMHFQGSCGKIVEGKTNLEANSNSGDTDEGFIVDDKNSEPDIFGPG